MLIMSDIYLACLSLIRTCRFVMLGFLIGAFTESASQYFTQIMVFIVLISILGFIIKNLNSRQNRKNDPETSHLDF